jgi:diphosphomevalonate decarboxylase
VVVVGETTKKVSSSEGHVLTESSPFYKARLLRMEEKIEKIKKALKDRNFQQFGEILEGEAINMHVVMMTSYPPLFYWRPKTMEIILAVQDWREEGISVYLTIDAGPNVHLICQAADEKKVLKKLGVVRGIKKIIVNWPAEGTRLINNHLF